MAPRKTTKTAADTPAEARDEQLEKAAAAIGQLASMGTALPVLDIDGMSQEQFDHEQRFQVALAVFPELVMSAFPKIDDENQAGMAARMAFEFADAFIAQSKKRDYDAG